MGLVLGILIIQEVLDELLPGFEGTIAEAEDFDAEADCNALNGAIDQIRMDTDTVIDMHTNTDTEAEPDTDNHTDTGNENIDVKDMHIDIDNHRDVETDKV